MHPIRIPLPGLVPFVGVVLTTFGPPGGLRALAVPPQDPVIAAVGSSAIVGSGLAIAPDDSIYLTGLANIGGIRDGVALGELGGEEFVHAGGSDFMLVKFNGNLEPVWSRTLGGRRFDYGTAVRVGPGGDVWVTATYQDDVIPSEQPPGYFIEGRADGFVARYTSEGTLVWFTPVNSSRSVNLEDLQVDDSGNAYVLGRIYDEITIGFTKVGEPAVVSVVLFRVGPDGQVGWASTVASGAETGAVSIALPASDRVVVAGGLGGGRPGIFLGEYDAAGTRRWLEEFPTGATEEVSDVAVDSAGNFYLCGRFHAAGFDVGGGVALANPNRTLRGYLLKLSPAREPLWIVPAGIFGSRMMLTADGTVILAGDYDGSSPDVGGEVQPVMGGLEAYLVAVRGDGSRAWVRSFATPAHEAFRSVRMSSDGSLIFNGGATPGALGVPPFRGFLFVGKLAPVVSPSRPALGFRLVDGALEVSWPTDSPGFALESASSPSGPFESGAPGAEPVEGQANTYRIPAVESERYYRLHRLLPP